jgi:hypothetical protein
MATVKPRRGTTTPGTGAIQQNELAIDTTNRRIFIGAANGSGILVGSAPAGSDTQVQFNDGGVLGATSGLTFNKTTSDVTITGDLNVNGADIFTSATGTATVFNTNATTLNIGGAATTIALGATASTTTTIRGGTLVGNQAIQNVFNTTATSVNAFGAALSIVMGSATGTSTRFRGPNTFLGPNIGQANFGSYGGALFIGTGSGGSFNTSTRPNLFFNSGSLSTLDVQGGDLRLYYKDGDNSTNCSLILWDYAGGFDYSAKLQVPTLGANRVITLPDATGTLAITASPTFTTSVLTSSTSFDVFNTTATTLNIGGAATSLSLGNTATAGQTVNMFTASTGASTYNFATGATAASTTKTLNIGTGGVASSTTNLNFGSSNGGTATFNCPLLSAWMPRVNSSAIITKTADYTFTEADNGKIFYIENDSKLPRYLTCAAGLSIGWRVRVFGRHTGTPGYDVATFVTSGKGGTIVYGPFGDSGFANSINEGTPGYGFAEVICYATDTFYAG